MTSIFTPSKSLEEPANGDYLNDWNVPCNSNWTALDNSLGGSSVTTVTGVVTGTYTLSLAQYQPPNIRFNGTIGATLIYQVPAGVGGLWTVYNNTTGANTLIFAVSGGGSLVMPQGQRSLIVSDGVNLSFAFSGPLSASVTLPENRMTNVITNSSYLQIPIVNAGTYELVFAIGFNAPSAAGMTFNVNYSGTFSSSGFLVYGATGSVGFLSPIVGQVQPTTTSQQYGIPGTGALQVIVIQGSITTTGQGTLAFSFGQTTTNASPTSLEPGSYEKVTPIA